MGERIPCAPSGKKVEIEIIDQGMVQYELAKRSNLVNSAISDILYGRNQYERTKRWTEKELGLD